MAICNTLCAPDLPASYTGGCGITTRPGGVKQIIFIKCDETWDWTLRSAWVTAVAANNAVFSGLILGQKPKGSFTKKRVASCQPESVVGGEKTLTFQDYNTDSTPGGCAVYDFWNTFQSQSSNYKMGYYSCDGYFYGPINDFTIEIDEVIEDNNTGSTYLDGSLAWNSITMICPVVVDLDGL